MRLLKFLGLFILLFATAAAGNFEDFLTMHSVRDFLISELAELNPNFITAGVEDFDLVDAFLHALDKKGKKSIFVTDLDETLLTSENFFGSTEWFKNSMADLRIQIRTEFPTLNDDEVEQKLDRKFWEYVAEHHEMKSVDRLYTYLLGRLHESGHAVLALTARKPDMRESTRIQMKSIGLDFLYQKTIFAPHNSDWTSNKGVILRLQAEQGFITWISSGDFFRMYFFDDSPKEINAVVKAFTEIPFIKKKQEIKIVHSLVSNENRKNDPLTRSFFQVGRFQQMVYQRTGLRVSNDSALEHSAKMSPALFTCYHFYK